MTIKAGQCVVGKKYKISNVVVTRYDFTSRCLPTHIAFVESGRQENNYLLLPPDTEVEPHFPAPRPGDILTAGELPLPCWFKSMQSGAVYFGVFRDKEGRVLWKTGETALCVADCPVMFIGDIESIQAQAAEIERLRKLVRCEQVQPPFDVVRWWHHP